MKKKIYTLILTINTILVLLSVLFPQRVFAWSQTDSPVYESSVTLGTYKRFYCIDAQGNYYYTNDQGYLLRRTPSGEITEIGSFGNHGTFPVYNVKDVVIKSGTIYVMNQYNGTTYQVSIYDSAGVFQRSISVVSSVSSISTEEINIDVNNAGEIYIAGASKIVKYSNAGVFLAESPGTSGLVTKGMELSSTGVVYTVNDFNGNIKTFDPSTLAVMGSMGVDCSSSNVRNMEIDNEDNILVLCLSSNTYILKYSPSGTLLFTFTPNQRNSRYLFYDHSNNKMYISDIPLFTPTVDTVKIYSYDKTPPQTTISSLLNGISGVNQSIGGTAIDSQSNISAVSYQIDSDQGNWNSCQPSDGYYDSLSENYTCSVSALTIGPHTIYVRSSDSRTNTSAIESYSFTTDATPPTGTVTINSGDLYTGTTNVTLNLTATDTESTVSSMKICTDSSFEGCASQSYATSISWGLLPGDGVKTIYVKFIDSVGNVSETYSDTILLDTQPPTGSVVINDNSPHSTTQVVTLKLEANDTISPVAAVMVSENADFTESNWQTYADTVSYTLTAQEGKKTVYVKFKDAAGNISSVYSDDIIYSVNSSDLYVTKTANRKIVLPGESFIYTINACNPSGHAVSATVTDNIPDSLFVISTDPYTKITPDLLTWQVLLQKNSCNVITVSAMVKDTHFEQNITRINKTNTAIDGIFFEETLPEDVAKDSITVNASDTSLGKHVQCVVHERTVTCSNSAELIDVFDTSTIYSLPPAYGSSGDNMIYTIDQTSWAESNGIQLYFKDSPSEDIYGGTGLSVDPTTGIFYAVVSSKLNARNDPGILVTVNPQTGEMSRINQFNGVRINSIAFTSTGVLYGTAGVKDTDTEGLFLIDKATAGLTKVMSLNQSTSARALAFNKDDNYMYYAYGYDKNIDVIDLATYSVNKTIQTSSNHRYPVAAWIYIGNNTFYADCWGKLSTVNVTTGEVTQIGILDHSAKGLAFPQQKLGKFEGSLLPNESFSVHVTATSTKSVALETDIVNTVHISAIEFDTDYNNNSASNTTPVNQYAELTIEGSATTSIKKGESVRYTYKVNNIGTIAAENVKLITDIPNGLDTSWSSNISGFKCSLLQSKIVCENGTVPLSILPGGTITIILTGKVKTAAPSQVTVHTEVSTTTPQASTTRNKTSVSIKVLNNYIAPHLSKSSVAEKNDSIISIPEIKKPEPTEPVQSVSYRVYDSARSVLMNTTVFIDDVPYITDSQGVINLSHSISSGAKIEILIQGKRQRAVISGDSIVAVTMITKKDSKSTAWPIFIVITLLFGVAIYLFVRIYKQNRAFLS